MKAITNARIYTMAGKIIEKGSIFWEGSKITAITDRLYEGENVYNAEGGIIVPGLINAHSHAGLKESLLGYVAGDDSNEKSFPVTPQLQALHGVNSEDIVFNKMLRQGITCVAVAPSNKSILSGNIAVLKTQGKTVDDMLITENVGIKAALGVEPKLGSITKTRMAMMAALRDIFYLSKGYQIAKDNAENNATPPYNIIAESLIPVLNKEIPLFIYVNRRDDIHTALRLAKEFSIKIVLVNAAEAHFVAEKLAKNNVSCISCPGLKPHTRFEHQEINWQGILTLQQAGVVTSVVPDSSTLPAYELTTIAMMLRKQGYSLVEVLASVTTNAAKILGIQDRVGSLEVGKDADMVLYEGEPFTINEKIKKVIINGQLIEGGE